MLEKIETEAAPKAIGPYSQAIAIQFNRKIIFVSGQIPLDPKTGKLVEGDIHELTRQSLENLKSILVKAGSNLESVVRTDVFLKDLKADFKGMNEEYMKHFKGPAFPARQTVEVSELPMGARVEISCIATTRD